MVGGLVSTGFESTGGLAISDGTLRIGGTGTTSIYGDAATSTFDGGINIVAGGIDINVPSCTQALETDANGAIICGTDAGGGGDPNLIYRTLGTTKFYTASSSSGDNLAFHFNNGFVSSASSTIAGSFAIGTSTLWGTFAIEQPTGDGRLKPIFLVGDTGTSSPFIFVTQKGSIQFGSSTPNTLLNKLGDVVIGTSTLDAASTHDHSDLFVMGGVGIGNATTTDGILETSGLSYLGGLLKVKGTGTSTVTQGLTVGTGGLETTDGLSVTGGASRLGTVVSGAWQGTA
ncbi:MAG: hypothetical protein AABZ49_04320, partial [Thermoproteota archaeon]